MGADDRLIYYYLLTLGFLFYRAGVCFCFRACQSLLVHSSCFLIQAEKVSGVCYILIVWFGYFYVFFTDLYQY
ncbi:hypothetical protein NRI_0312 [Neorickettsia risticii str. Illinois]|uniref:Uncharacterized protein n=1 Tax=Neorickettsia risticii (strain Illinois) TaxID=434131 RepID=C6V4I3_NEORI|nr:hypothetical protein NRI_0312 [Neorickettsia risticii str. Illinois]